MLWHPSSRVQALSLTEGALRQAFQGARISNASGAAIEFSLTYSSANADGSKMQLDTGLGAGWTHSYNVFLFTQSQQPENLFRLDAEGRVTVFTPTGGGTFRPNGGYFEVLTANADGTFSVQEKTGIR